MRIFFVLMVFLFPVMSFAHVAVVDANATPIYPKVSDNTIVSNASDLNARVTQLEKQMQQLQQTVKDLELLISGKNEATKAQPMALTTQSSTNNTSAVPKQKMVSFNSSSSKNESRASQLYYSGINAIKSKRYSEAISVLQSYLKNYPNGQYVSNAHYWLGQLMILSGNNDEAQQEFETVANGGQSNKTPDAMLKLGDIAHGATKYSQAQIWWNRVVTQYPKSNAAKIAQNRLDQMQQAGDE